MPPVYEALLLNTVVPQIQAAQAGDSYVMVVNATTPALRITQTGTGNALEVEDSSNPDSTPFVVSSAGDVGVGTNTPAAKLDVRTTSFTPTGSNIALLLEDRAAFSQALQFYLNNAGTFFSSRPSGAIGSVNSSDLRISGAGVITGNFATSVNSFIPSTTSAGVISVGGTIDFYTAGSLTAGVAMDMATNLRMRLDSSGNLGLGVTPSVWATVTAMQVKNASFGGFNNNAYFSANWYYNAGDKYIASDYATSYQQVSGEHRWFRSTSAQVANTDPVFNQAMTLDASGNLGVGATSALSRIDARAASATMGNYQTIQAFSTDTSAAIDLGGGISLGGFYNSTQIAQYASIVGRKANGTAGNYDGYLAFGTNAQATGVVERARITSGGDLLVGTNSGTAYKAQFYTGDQIALLGYNTNSAKSVGDIWNAATSGDNIFFNFLTEANGALRGSITYNRTGGLVAYNTTSDYRAKDVFGPVTDTGATIDALKVYNGKMKGATVERPMLIAHEAQAVTPYAVTGEKDAVDEDGKPKYQQMDVSSLVPLLIAEIQSLRARVAQLEAK